MAVSEARGGKRRGWIIAGGAAAAAAGWIFLRRLAGQMLLALALTGLALPLARRLEKKWNRSLAAGVSVAGLMAVILGAVGLLAPPLISQASFLIVQAPQLLDDLLRLLEQLSRQEWAMRLGLNESMLRQGLLTVAGWAAGSLPGLIQGIGAGMDVLSRAILSPVLAYYFVRDRETFCYHLSLWIPLKHRKRVLAALREMRREAGGYGRGQALVAGAVAAFTALGLMLAGVPGWLVLGALMGVCEFIPYIGPLIGGLPIALLAFPLGWRTFFRAMGLTVLVQQIEGYFLSPRLMAGATGLHPVAVLLLLSAGGTLGGLMGMVAAVPAFVCARGAARVLLRTEKSPGEP